VTDKVTKAKIGVEIIKGKADSEEKICLALNEDKDNPAPSDSANFVEATAKLSSNCGGGCCIFELKDKSA